LCWAGKTHDYRILKEEFPPEQDWFANHRLRVDLGFQGMADDYKCKELSIPHKKKKKQELTSEQKEENKLLAGDRIFIEHALGGMKRYRILSDRLRMHETCCDRVDCPNLLPHSNLQIPAQTVSVAA
jgi:hypothetical protein